MTVVITREDVEMAIAARATEVCSRCCPVFQAMRRHNIPVAIVGYYTVKSCDGSDLPNLPEAAERVTKLLVLDWPGLETPISFDYPYTPAA